MNKKGLFNVLLSCLMVAGLAAPYRTNAVKAQTGSQWDISRYGDKLDIDPKLSAAENDAAVRAKLDETIKASAKGINFTDIQAQQSTAATSNFTYDGGTKIFLGYDTINGYYLKNYTLRSIGDKVEVWVSNNLSFPKGDSRPAHIVTQEQVDKLRDEFDKNIYQKDTEFFGTPASRVGSNAVLDDKLGLPADYYAPSDGKERVIMLVDNFRDENYYDPTYPFYVAGFFSPTFSRYFDRNIINIDSNKWDVRLANNDIYGTIAHEFQHLIHRDNDPGEETWINEGMSDFAQYLCGYGHDWGHVNYFLDHPENSLVSWDEYYSAPTGPETLADYGQAYLLQLYLNDHFGKNFIQALAKDKDHGIASMNKILAKFNTGIDFSELFRRFFVALSVDSKNPGNGEYYFNSIDVKVNYKEALEHEKDGVPAWGSDYIKLDNSKNIKDILFNGESVMSNSNPWMAVDDPKGSGDKVFWGNKVDDNDNKLAFEIDLTNVSKATLKFDHYYDIEETWDYGLVQVSTDGAKTWTSLSNADTRSDLDPDGREQIRNNLPGFTGTNGGWTNEQFDLTPYAGKKILLCFRYMTDDATTEDGWFINNIDIPEINYHNDCSSTQGTANLEKILGNYINYMVTFVNEKYTKKGTDPQHYQVHTLNPVSMTEADTVEMQKYLSSGNNYMIIWYAAPIGQKGVAPYSYDLVLKKNLRK